MSQNSQCITWDFTYHTEDKDHTKIVSILKEHCKQWGFQGEVGNLTGKFHFQGRFKLNKKCRISSIPFKLGHYSITSTPNTKADTFYAYVTKDYTRESGPWTDRDVEIYIPKQVRDINLLPWQQSVVNSFKVWDTRSINIIHCPEGNIGKSTLATYTRAHQLAVVLPPINDQKDMLRVVFARAKNTDNAFIIDMPRAMKKDKLFGLYSGMETVKDGFSYDDRYEYREKVFDCPVMWVFTNTMPDTTMLSIDRWKFWRVNKDKELESFKI